ncbi:MAG: hypothetical protein ACHQ5A_13425 [Opitutales bacterium]
MPLLRFLAVLAALALSAAGLRAAERGFITTLSAEQQAAAGLTRLSAGEQTALNALVAREVAFARQGNVRAFAGTFVSRRKPAERTEAGLDRLTSAEQARLNDAVAAAIAAGPVLPEPRELTKSDVTNGQRLQVHGSISFTYGWGGGGSFRAGSLYTDIYDPVTGTELGIGLSESSGNGWWGWDSGYDGYDPYRFDRPWPVMTDFHSDWADARASGNYFLPGRFNGTGSCFQRH